MSRILLLAGLLVLVGAGPVRCGDDPTPALEAELGRLRAETVPKREFWEITERQGRLMADEKALLAERDRIIAGRSALETELAAAERELEEARASRERAEAGVIAARAEREAASAEREAHRVRLEAFVTRRGEATIE